jgi:hypothetical protein
MLGYPKQEAKMKKCTGCKIEKDEVNFGKQSKARDGLNEKCKECCKARSKLTVRSEEAIENQKKYININVCM